MGSQKYPYQPAVLLCLIMSAVGMGKESESTETDKDVMVKHPQFTRAEGVSHRFEGVLNEYLGAVSKNWLQVTPERNPFMLDMFADREHKLMGLPWVGEYAGKYLSGAAQLLSLTNDKELRDYLQRFVNRLIELQSE
ncbi:MAG: hypothetical protein ACE5GO_09920, partial [Anaerolineales bacterium]